MSAPRMVPIPTADQPHGGGAAVEVGDQAIAASSAVTGSLCTGWSDWENAPARSYTVTGDGVEAVEAGLYQAIAHCDNSNGGSTVNPYVAIVRGGEEIGPLWDMGIAVPAGGSGEVSATVVAEVGDTLTVSSNHPELRVRMLVTRIS